MSTSSLPPSNNEEQPTGVPGPALGRAPAVGFIFLTLFLDVLGFGLLIPVGPDLVAKVADVTRDDAAKYTGYLAATYAAMQFLFAPLLGVLSDRFGRRPVLLVSLLGSGLDYFAMAIAWNLPMLFVTRAINGFSGASMTVASSYIADVTPPEKRAGAFGMIGAAFGLGFIFGPLIGGILGDIDIHYPFYAAGALTLLNWLYGLMVVPESLPPQRRAPLRLWRANPLGAFVALRRYSLVLWLAGVFFTLNVAQFGLHLTWTVYTKHKFAWSSRMVGASMFCVGLSAAVVQGGLARKLIPWLGERKSLLFGILTAVVAFSGYGLATQGWMIFVIISLASIGGIAQPAAQSLVTRTVHADEQGATQGALSSVNSLAQICGPLVGTQAFDYALKHDLPPGLPFFIGSGLCVVALVLALAAFAKHEERATHNA